MNSVTLFISQNLQIQVTVTTTGCALMSNEHVTSDSAENNYYLKMHLDEEQTYVNTLILPSSKEGMKSHLAQKTDRRGRKYRMLEKSFNWNGQRREYLRQSIRG